MRSANFIHPLLLAAWFGVASFGLCAQGADPGAPDQTATDAAMAGEAEGADLAELDCIRETGTRIKPRESAADDCLNLPGRSYSRKDIERTGHANLAEALRMLDPSIR
jgi:hypothetical protein